MLKFLAKDYQTRSDLENAVRNKCGLTPEIKEEYLVSGTKDELKKLHLSENTIFWGIRCEAVDSKPKGVTQPKPERGEIHSFGINQRDKNPK